MNILGKSILIGTVVAIGFSILWDLRMKNQQQKKYTISATIKVEPDTSNTSTFSFSKVLKTLEQRLEAANYQYKIKRQGENEVYVAISGIADTISPFSMLIANDRIQFREVYNMRDLIPMLSKANEIMYELAVPEKKIATAVERDSMSKLVNDLLDSIEKYEQTPKTNNLLIDLIIHTGTRTPRLPILLISEE